MRADGAAHLYAKRLAEPLSLPVRPEPPSAKRPRKLGRRGKRRKGWRKKRLHALSAKQHSRQSSLRGKPLPRQRPREEALLNTRKARKAARKAKKRQRK